MITTAAIAAFKSLVSIPGLVVAEPSGTRKTRMARSQVADLLLKEEVLDEMAMVSIADSGGNIIYVNKLFSEISGFSRSEIVGKSTYAFLYHEDTPHYIFEEIYAHILQGKSWKGEVKCRKKDGGYYWAMNTVMPVMGPNGKAEKIISVRHDISRQKKMEEMVEEYRAKSFRDLYENVQYAGHIHRSLMPDTEQIKAIFPRSFVNYIPRNIIGGDFFWFNQKGDRKLVALGDSTGHGVSASLISSLAVSNLINIVESAKEIKPSSVLKELNARLARITNQNNQMVITESADTAVLDIDTKKRLLTYASGKTRILLLRNRKVSDLKRDNQTIGGSNNEEIDLNDHQVQLEQGDRIFLFSDGYIDQFGGRHEKKLGSKRLRAILEKTSVFDMDTQAMLLKEYILHWKGSNPQTDDISMIGIEIE